MLMFWDCVTCLRIRSIPTLLTVSSRVTSRVYYKELFHNLFVLLGRQLSFRKVTSSSYTVQGQVIVFTERFIISFDLQQDFINGNKTSGAIKLHSWHVVEVLCRSASDP